MGCSEVRHMNLDWAGRSSKGDLWLGGDKTATISPGETISALIKGHSCMVTDGIHEFLL